MISRRFQIAARTSRARNDRPRTRQEPASVSLAMRERTRKKQIQQSRKSALQQDATMVLTAVVLTYFRPFSSLRISLSTSFFYAIDSLDLRRRRNLLGAFSSLSLNTPTLDEIQFYSANCFLLYHRLLR